MHAKDMEVLLRAHAENVLARVEYGADKQLM
jgi:hypothetical protein